MSINVKQDVEDTIFEYALALISHELCPVDNGRMLGYDDAHGFHERHWMGKAEPYAFTTHDDLFATFEREAREIKRTR